MSQNSLTEQDYRSLEQSYIPREWADRAGLYRVDNYEGAEVIERQVKRGTDYSGIALPYFAPGADKPLLTRLRRDHPDYEEDPTRPDGWKARGKYLVAQGHRNSLYYWRDVNPTWRGNASIPLYIVEGEKKTLALQRYFIEHGPNALVAGIAGIWSWRTVKTDVDKGVLAGKGLLYDFNYLTLKDRLVYVIFDADATQNEHVEKARRALVNRLRQSGAVARWLDMPSAAETNCKGIDDLLGAKGPEYVRGWLEDAMSKPADEDYINLSQLSEPAIIEAAWQALERNNRPPHLFQRSGRIYRLETDDSGAEQLREMTTGKMRLELMDAAVFVRISRKGDTIPAEIPHTLPSDLLSAHPIPLPFIDKIVRVPVFSASGTLRLRPGYDPYTRTYLAPPKGMKFKPLPAKGEIDIFTVQQSLAIVREMLQDFPLWRPVERTDDMSSEEAARIQNANYANALGLFLLPFCRRMIDGPTPLHALDSNENGAGKTLIGQCLMFPSLLRFAEPTAIPSGNRNNEIEKRLDAILLSNEDVVFLDNVNEDLASGTLASMATANDYSIRPFGRNDAMVKVPVRQPFIITGMNLQASNELSRRMSLIALETDESDPESRTGLKNLKEWTQANADKLIYAAHIMIQYWIQEGKPAPQYAPPVGSYDEWSHVIGGILETCDVIGFQANRRILKQQVNAEKNALRDFIELWYQKHQSNRTKAADVFDMALNCSSFNLSGSTPDKLRHSFGIALAKHARRVFDVEKSETDKTKVRVKLVIAGTSKGTRDYCLKELSVFSE